MKFGLEQINDIAEKLVAENLTYQSSVIVGDNSGGKSLLLNKFIEKHRRNNNIYYIDAVNRGFDVKKVSGSGKKPEYKMTILETRMEDTYFNLADSFNCFGTLTERIEMIYHFYEEDVQNLFCKLTGDRFRVLYGDPIGKVDFGNGCGLLSSGYQAIIRILLELLYYQEMVIFKQNVEKSWVVIDELDEFLSPKYSATILEFLKVEFPWAKWLVTTHSCDLVANTSNMNLIVLDNCAYEVMDINDYSSISEVQIIFQRLFGNQIEVESEIDNTLRCLLHNKINNAWSDRDDISLKKMQSEHLSASQKIILKQIQEW